MRTTITLDDDVVALIEAERAQTGESFRSAVNRLLRRGARGRRRRKPPPLPRLRGGPILDIADVSSVLAALDDERRAQRGVP